MDKKNEESANDVAEQNYSSSKIVYKNQSFLLKEIIGRGTFSVVYNALDEQTGEDIAMKVMDDNVRNMAINESNILSKLSSIDKHGYFVNFLQMFEVDHKSYLLFDLEIGTLKEFYISNNALSSHMVRHFGKQLCGGLQILECCGIVHCDLKPENILVHSDANGSLSVKISDFGNNCSTREMRETYVQTRAYRAPEIIFGSIADSPIDIWSLGCIFVEMVTCKVLFDSTSLPYQIHMMVKMLGVPPSKLLDKFPKATFYFVKSSKGRYKFREEICTLNYSNLVPTTSIKPLSVDLDSLLTPDEKFVNDQLKFNQESFSQFVDLVRKMLVYDPAKRIDAFKAMQHQFFKTV